MFDKSCFISKFYFTLFFMSQGWRWCCSWYWTDWASQEHLWKSHYTVIISSEWKIMVILIFILIEAYLCGIWNLWKEKLYPVDSSLNSALDSSINSCSIITNVGQEPSLDLKNTNLSIRIDKQFQSTHNSLFSWPCEGCHDYSEAEKKTDSCLFLKLQSKTTPTTLN